MKTLAAALALTLITSPAFSQALDGNSLTWLAGSRVSNNADGSKTYEAFIGPQNGTVTGTALARNGTYTEYHKLGPGPDGKTYGLSVANPRSNMAWGFTPLKEFQKDRVVFQTPDGARTITYFAKPAGGVGALVESKAVDGKVTKTEYDFQLLPLPK
jgi:hypothetical protein